MLISIGYRYLAGCFFRTQCHLIYDKVTGLDYIVLFLVDIGHVGHVFRWEWFGIV